MKKLNLPDRVVEVTEADFWSSLAVPRACANPGALRAAIRLGRAGRREEAYGALAAYHGEALAGEWERLRAAHLALPAPKPEALRELLGGTVTAWHTQKVQLGSKIDWLPSSLLWDSTHGFHYLHWLRPAITALVQTGRPEVRAFVLDVVTQYAEAVRRPEWRVPMETLAFGLLGVHAKWEPLLTSYLALMRTGEVPVRTVEGLLKLFLSFGRSLCAQLKTYVPGNNSFSASNTNLLHMGLVLPEFRESAAWRRRATALLLAHAREGFYADGGNRERVWGYGIMHLQALTDGYALARRHGGLGRHDREVRAVIRRACRWYAQTVTPEPWGAFPTYGDAGWGAHDRLATIRRLARSIPGLEGELNRAAAGGSCLLKDSGFAILRNGTGPGATYANLSFGEFAGWHSHWDLLSLNVWAQGEPLLEELCRFGPYGTPLDVLFRAPESHNQTLIDGMVYDSRTVKGEEVVWHSDERVDLFSATHRAYRYFCYGRESGSPVSPNVEAVVRRTVALVKDPGYLVVMDSVRDLNAPFFSRAISQYWHAPQPFRVLDGQRARTEGAAACLLCYARPDGLVRLDTGCDFTAGQAAGLGHGYDRYSLRARRWMPLDYKGNTGFAVVIYPFKGRAPDVRVTPLALGGGAWWEAEALEVEHPRGRDVIVLNPERRKGLELNGKPVAGRALFRLGKGRGDVAVR